MLPGRKYSPEDLLGIAWQRRWLLAAGLVVFGAIALGISLKLPNLYKSETLILVIPQRIPESYVRSTVTMRIEDRLRSISQEILSRTRLEKIINEFNLYPDRRKAKPMEVVVEEMRADVLVETVKDDAFRIAFTARDPRTAMIVTDRLSSMFIDENTRDRSVMAEGTNAFLESQLEDARRRLIDHEKKLEEFRKRNSGELPSQLQTNLQVIQGTNNQIQNLNESINRDKDRRLVLEKSVADALASDVPAAAPPLESSASADSNALGDGRAIDQLEKARNDLMSMQLRLKPGHPDVIAKKRLIAELEFKVQQEAAVSPQNATPSAKPATTAELIRQQRARQYQSEIEKLDRQIASKESDVARLRQQVADYQRRVEAVPGHESEQTDLMRDYETLQKSYASLLAKKEESKISANLERQQVSEQFKILDPARLPQRPSSPDRVKITALGAALGLGLAAALTAFLEYRDVTIRSEDEILRTLVLPVLAAIPIVIGASERRRQRRVRIASMAVSILATIGIAAATLWRLGVLKGIR
jgi:polysaccharide chain length determinant protein (PEP-CTERM system associated)